MVRFLPFTVIALCAVLALTSCSDSEGPLGRSDLPQTPSAQVDINREGGGWGEQFFDDELPFHCLDETILISGIVSARVMEVETGEGFHRHVQFIIRGTGVGQTSGAVYVFHNSHPTTFNSNSLGAEERTDVINILLVSKGDSANSAFQVRVHWTMSATGEFTVDFVKAGCRA